MMPSFDFTGLTLSLQPGVPPSVAVTPIISIGPSLLATIIAAAGVAVIAAVVRRRRRAAAHTVAVSRLRRAA